MSLPIRDIDTAARLEDAEVRAAYGAATLHYDLAAVLVAARETQHLTQEGLAQRAGVSHAYIAKLERGEANPTLSRLGALLAAMGLTLDIHCTPLVPTLPPLAPVVPQ